jgi:hypothetical protein
MIVRPLRILSVCALAMLIHGMAYAQASIGGVVRDASGAVLPGVTVEAASPALIEKVRTVVTDGAGLYNIIDLRAGTYTVTFTLTGFNTVRREGIELEGNFAATVNVDLRVGAIEETITVTGQAPVVDVQSTREQVVVNRELIRDIPTTRQYYSAAALIPGVVISGAPDVGGSSQPAVPDFTIHGARTGDGRLTVDGISVAQRGGAGDSGANRSMYVLNVGSVQETTVSTSGGLGESETAGILINMVPREGGNTHRGSFFAAFANGAMQGSNFDDEIRARGLRTPNELQKVWEITPQEGGPILTDRMWYFVSGRWQGSRNWVAGMYHNLNAGDITKWTYEPDLSRRAMDDGTWKSLSLRLTYQATGKDKLAGFWDEQDRRQAYLGGGSATTSPEASSLVVSSPSRAYSLTWTRPHTSRVLLEAGIGGTALQYDGKPREPLRPEFIRVQEQAGLIPGLTYRQQTWRNNFLRPTQMRGSISYVTGTHTAKFGFQRLHNYYKDNDMNPNPLSYRFNNGVPNQLTLAAMPQRLANINTAGIYAQDSWKINRLTLQGGLRFDTVQVDFPDQVWGFNTYVPNGFAIPAFKGPRLNELTPRMAASYDVAGDGRTALKMTLGKYPTANEVGLLGEKLNPTLRLVATTSRAWNDANRNYVPDCDLLNPNANGECGAYSNRNFGRQVYNETFDDELLAGGWGLRQYNWEFSTTVQREVFRATAVEVGYFRRWYGNQLITDNRSVGPGDFDTFNITAPSDPRLPGGGGYTLTGFQDVRPEKFGLVDNLIARAENYGGKKEYWQGVDINLTSRLAGVTLQGGTSMGSMYEDNCELVKNLPEIFVGGGQSPLSFCKFQEDLRVQVKALASYVVPRVDVLISGSFQSTPGGQLAANFNASNAVLAPSLGRNLSGNAANTSLNIVEPGKQWGERINLLDIRFGKILRFGGVRTNVSIDIYNALNRNPGTSYNQTFGANYLVPNAILQARFAKFSMHIDW